MCTAVNRIAPTKQDRKAFSPGLLHLNTTMVVSSAVPHKRRCVLVVDPEHQLRSFRGLGYSHEVLEENDRLVLQEIPVEDNQGSLLFRAGPQWSGTWSLTGARWRRTGRSSIGWLSSSGI